VAICSVALCHLFHTPTILGNSSALRFRARDDEHTLAQEWDRALLVVHTLLLQRLPKAAAVIRARNDSVPEGQSTAHRSSSGRDIQIHGGVASTRPQHLESTLKDHLPVWHDGEA